MSYIICTLFEKHYHLGVASLVNSLYESGYRGEIYAGFRGNLPTWAKNTEPNHIVGIGKVASLKLKDNLLLHFIPLTTDYHLTNYKPDFMINLLQHALVNIEGIFYFDPDIVVTTRWAFFEAWIKCGVALCEDVNSPLQQYHPRRVAWRNYFLNYGMTLHYKENIYANGGFCGVTKTDISYLKTWKAVQEAMANSIGGLSQSIFNNKQYFEQELLQGVSPFSKTDQDALNAAVEAWDGKVSFLGQESMGFRYGDKQMSHALGQPKPWKVGILKQMLYGRALSQTIKDYWIHSNGAINSQPPNKVKWKMTLLLIAKFVSKFYS